MSFTLTCPHCKQELEADESLIGQELNCPACGNALAVIKEQQNVPLDSQKTSKVQEINDEDMNREITFFCPNCGTEKKISASMIGSTITCDGCAEEVVVSESEERSCPHCGKMIKAKAKVCKFCKKPIFDNLPLIQQQNTIRESPLPQGANVKGTKMHGLIGFLLTIPCLIVCLFMKGCAQGLAVVANGRKDDYLGYNDYVASEAGTPFNVLIFLILILSIVCFVLSFFGKSQSCRETGIGMIVCSSLLLILYGCTLNILGFAPAIIFLLAGRISISNAKHIQSQGEKMPASTLQMNSRITRIIKKIIRFAIIIVTTVTATLILIMILERFI